MISVPSADPVGALVPHTLQEPLLAATSGPLAGLTFMVKDLFAIAGRKVSNGNPDFYEHATPANETAPVITRLLDAGASCTGITICDEFFYSVLGSNAHYGQPINSRAPKHVTGGSSCGSAAAVAASMCDFALGSDTGGSIRVPASFSGLYGLRPTFGRIDTKGATPMAPSYDTIGFLAREAELARKIGHVLLEGDGVAAKIDRLILAEDFFGHAEASADQALWRVLASIGPALPAPEHRTIVGEEIDQWRDAFRLIQGFEIQSTLLPFIQSHNADLGPGIKERFEAAAQITYAEAEAARSQANGDRATTSPRSCRRVRWSCCRRRRRFRPSVRFPTAPPSPSSARRPSAIPASPVMPACRRSPSPRPRPPVAPSAFPSLAGRAPTKPCSISPSGLSPS